MAFYIQYDADGNILATVSGATEPPSVDNATRWQIECAEWTDTQSKKVDPETMQLVDAPQTE